MPPANNRFPGLFVLCFTLFAGCSSEDNTGPVDPTPLSDVPSIAVATSIGSVLVAGDDEKTLYILPNDPTDTVTCVDGCAQIWPPLSTEFDVIGVSGDFDPVERPDGTWQWMYKGYPLYFYANDQNSGDVTGHGLGGSWFAARPNPVAKTNSVVGEILVSQGSSVNDATNPEIRVPNDGRTLYHFADDTADTSNCIDACALDWPPLYADTGSILGDDFSLITRGSDEPDQLAYKGKPLYYYINDAAPGDILGDLILGWSIATP